jgi:hypothetical protein
VDCILSEKVALIRFAIDGIAESNSEFSVEVRDALANASPVHVVVGVGHGTISRAITDA